MVSRRPEQFDWMLVRSFLAVLEAGSVTGAARRLGAKQPTVSRHIAELEAQLGTPLFERTGRGVSATAAAQSIATAARKMDDGATALLHGLARARDTPSGTVRITTSQAVAVWVMPRVLADLRACEPGIQVELVATNEVSNLIRREADIAVRMARPRQRSLIAKRLPDVAIVAAAHKTYLDRAGVPSRPHDLLRHSLLGFDRNSQILRAFLALGVPATRDHFALRTDDQVAYGRLVAEGAGIGFVAAYCIPHWSGVTTILPQLKIPRLPCWLAVHREIRGNRIVRRVFDFLSSALPPALEAD